MNTEIIKPSNLAKHGLIAIYNTGEKSLTPRDFMHMPYIINELAVNRVSNKIQVYVLSDTVKGLNEFKKDYPNAELQKDASLEVPQDWEILAFPTEPIDDTGTALDYYFHAFSKANAVETELTSLEDKPLTGIDEQ